MHWAAALPNSGILPAPLFKNLAAPAPVQEGYKTKKDKEEKSIF